MFNENAIELNNAFVGYGDVTILKNLDFKVKIGEFVSILGENGAGKTTLFKSILLILPLTKGTIRVFDKEVAWGRDNTWLRSQIGYVPQNHNKGNFPISVFDATLLGRWGSSFSYFKRPSLRDKEITREILRVVNLEDMMHHDCKALSGGQTQRLNIARALVRKPRILLLDEPTTHLDVDSQRKLDATISNIRNQYELSVIMISHDKAHAISLSDRIVYLRNGKIYNDIGVPL
ncbi:ABC transporter ATP-binding protein [Alkaliphilus pronyensis]|uniref:ABC transporter ATP-binding protein n=1 Tax=Alkaliphilus pronyensis TaxID=1482732 RepID=A0A6I0EXZ2_9FIRM|nr:ABC transporter ATP-binding protein [Alkaliphilus pronyensis]KAB3532769.1 ABC transporter ATP-binding protein [Alkaliphilus pronyensis]